MKGGPIYDMRKLKQDTYGSIKGYWRVCWGQDNKIFLENNNIGIFKKSHDPRTPEILSKQLNVESQSIHLPTQGGNCYLGKKPGGETFVLVGKDALKDRGKKIVADSFNVKPENLHVISQPNFHIDMAVRPLTYPYVLVGDSKLTASFAKKQLPQERRRLIDEQILNNNAEYEYAKTGKIIKELKAQGFEPIRVPGMLSGERGINFMNAIVHQKSNGNLVYITNKTHLREETGVDFEGIFEKDLKSKFPKVKEVIFIDGDGLVQNFLTTLEGGVHCITCEKPNFEKWDALLKKQTRAARNSHNAP